MIGARLTELPSGPRVQDAVKELPGVVTGRAPGEDKAYTRTTVDGIQLPDGGERREFDPDRLSSALMVTPSPSRSAEAETPPASST